eukprot:1530361-Prymnesium_polylepis.2
MGYAPPPSVMNQKGWPPTNATWCGRLTASDVALGDVYLLGVRTEPLENGLVLGLPPKQPARVGGANAAVGRDGVACPVAKLRVCLGKGPALSTAIEAQTVRAGGGDLPVRRLSILDVEGRSRGRPPHGEQVEIAQVADVHVGPDVLPRADVHPRARANGSANHHWQLVALSRQPERLAVDGLCERRCKARGQ